MGPIGCPETSERNCHQSLRCSPEGCGSLLLTYVSVLAQMFLKIYIFKQYVFNNYTYITSVTYIYFSKLHKGYKQFQINFYVLLTCISMHLCNEDQPNALRIRSLFRQLTLRRLMSYIYIYGAPILDVSRSHTTTQHSR